MLDVRLVIYSDLRPGALALRIPNATIRNQFYRSTSFVFLLYQFMNAEVSRLNVR
jgi:hypothetical protein